MRNEMDNETEVGSDDGAAAPRAREVSGRRVVVGMFVFGIFATSGLWAYWYLHTAPFRPLQLAIAENIPGSNPRVEGGQRKIHKETPRILRITIRVDFDPKADEARANKLGDQLLALARKHQDLTQYDLLEMYLFHRIPEQEIRERLIAVHLTHESGR
jgi:hypothetical protein